MKIIVMPVPTKLGLNFVLFVCFLLAKTKHKNPILASWYLVTKDISAPCFERIAFYFKGMPYSINF